MGFLLVLTWGLLVLVSTLNFNQEEKRPNKESSTELTPEHFGAEGDDQKVDTVAFQQAIDSGRDIILKNGATYIIDKPLVIDHSITIRSVSASDAPAVIVRRTTKAVPLFLTIICPGLPN